MVWLRLVHILSGIFWVGSTVVIAAFLIPAARASGVEGRRFVRRLMQGRGLGLALGLSMLLTVVSGFVMYGRLSAGFNRAWATSRPGMALAVGALAALLAVVVGVGVTAPVGIRIERLQRRLEAASASPAPADAARVAALQSLLDRLTVVTALLLIVAAAAMAVARYL